jgi:hypothetical protein
MDLQIAFLNPPGNLCSLLRRLKKKGVCMGLQIAFLNPPGNLCSLLRRLKKGVCMGLQIAFLNPPGNLCSLLKRLQMRLWNSWFAAPMWQINTTARGFREIFENFKPICYKKQNI